MPDYARKFRAALQATVDRDGKKAVSERAGISRSGLDTYLEGTTVPNLDTAGKIADALGMKLWEMLGAPPPGAHTIADCYSEIGRRLQISPPSPGPRLVEFGEKFAQAKDDGERAALVASYLANLPLGAAG